MGATLLFSLGLLELDVGSRYARSASVDSFFGGAQLDTVALHSYLISGMTFLVFCESDQGFSHSLASRLKPPVPSKALTLCFVEKKPLGLGVDKRSEYNHEEACNQKNEYNRTAV